MHPDDAPTSISAAAFGSPSDHPKQMGPYRILHVLGEGGMGVVYLAEQTSPIFRRVALKVLKRSLREADKRLRSTLGNDHPDLVTLLSHLGDAQNGSGDRDGAERTFRQAVALGVKALPPDHPDTARVRVRLGNLLVGAKRFEEAEPILVPAVDAREKSLAREHAATKAAYEDLAKLYDAWDRTEKAAEWRQRASRN